VSGAGWLVRGQVPGRDVSLRPVFSIGEKTYDVADVIVAAMVRGDWTALEERVRQGLGCLRGLEDAGDDHHDPEIEEAAREFRQTRNLLTAQETEDWLERVGLTFDEWADFIERSTLSDIHAASTDAFSPQSAVDWDEIRQKTYVEAVCSGDLERFAHLLAGRAAVCQRAIEEGSVETPGPPQAERQASEECATAVGSLLGIGMSPDAIATRVSEISQLDARFHAYTRDSVTAAAVRAQIEAHRVEWTRVDWHCLALSAESIAREVVLCLREDGATLSDVAAKARVPAREETLLLESVDEAIRAALLASNPGDVLGPLPLPQGFRVALLVSKAPPAEDDGSVRRRAEEEVVANLVDREKRKRVRWHATF
jgi:hypothetical protein